MRSPSPDNLPRKCIDYYNNILFNNNDIFDEEYKYIRYRSPSPEPVEKGYKYILIISFNFILLLYMIIIYGISFSSNYE